jgi:hypothetical protein
MANCIVGNNIPHSLSSYFVAIGLVSSAELIEVEFDDFQVLVVLLIILFVVGYFLRHLLQLVLLKLLLLLFGVRVLLFVLVVYLL